MDSTAQTTPRDYDIINETASTGDAWIRQPIQPLGTEISSTKLHPRVTLGFNSPNSPRDSEMINELLSRMTDGFDSPNSP
jgi:hypothetical protein